MQDTLRSPNSVWAVLPSGEVLEPGAREGCPGPDAYGACLTALAGDAPLCAGAVWYYGTPPTWRFELRSDSGVCPASMLDPLGLLSVPLD
jgi:hypothetical protein